MDLGGFISDTSIVFSIILVVCATPVALGKLSFGDPEARTETRGGK